MKTHVPSVVKDPMNKELSASDRQELIARAIWIAQAAYAPYSKFRVGSAVLGQAGIYAGANVENASWGLSLCAERSALSAALAAGDREIRAIAVACIDAEPSGPVAGRMPCGACRQWIAELAPQATILIAYHDREYSIDDLLPSAFRLG